MKRYWWIGLVVIVGLWYVWKSTQNKSSPGMQQTFWVYWTSKLGL